MSAVNENLKFILSETMAHYRVGGSGFRVNTDNMSIHNSFHMEARPNHLVTTAHKITITNCAS